MAALRNAARRLGGSVLQRTQAAVASPAVPEGQRGLFLPRLYSTESKIQQKKEELYNMISKAEKRTFQNNRLIRHLSVQVKPRTGDPKWHLLRIKKWMTDVVVVSGFFALGLAFTGHLRQSARQARKEARRVKNKLEV